METIRSVCLGCVCNPTFVLDLPYRTQNLCLKKVCVDPGWAVDRNAVNLRTVYSLSFVYIRKTSCGARSPFFSCRSRAANAARVHRILPSGSCSFLTTGGLFQAFPHSLFVFGGVLFCLIRVYQMKPGLAIDKAHNISSSFLYICYHAMDFRCTSSQQYNVLSHI